METRISWPLIGLLTVQFLTGMVLMPMNNFFGIFLNEQLLIPARQVALVVASGQIAGMIASFIGGAVSDQ